MTVTLPTWAPRRAELVVPAPTGIAAEDTANLQALIDRSAGAAIVLRAGTYVVTQLLIGAYTRLVGQGIGLTVLKLADGANVDLIKTRGFDANTGTTNVGADHSYSLEHLTLTGNSANNSSGRGIAAYGYRPRFSWLEITDFPGLGLYHEWRATAGTPSGGLAEHDMHGRLVGLDVHDNLGGGIDYTGPSDSNMIMCDSYRNGPASSSTTIGLRVRGNATSLRAHLCHVWGTQHNIGASIEASGYQSHECDYEGSITAPVVIDASNGVIKGGKIFIPGVSGVGIQFGVLGHATVGGWDIDTFMSSCNINLVRDGGGNTWRVHAFWTDATKQLFTGTMSTSAESHYEPFVGGGLQVGLPNFATISTRRARIKDVRRIATPGRPDNVLYQSGVRTFQDQSLTGFTLGQWVVVLLEVEAEIPVSTICFIPGSAALPTSPSHCWYALFNVDTKAWIASTVDDVTGLAIDTPHPLAINSVAGGGGGPWIPSTDQRVYAAIALNAASGTFSLEGSFAAAGVAKISPQIAGLSGSGLTDPATWGATALGALTGGTKVPYAYLA